MLQRGEGREEKRRSGRRWWYESPSENRKEEERGERASCGEIHRKRRRQIRVRGYSHRWLYKEKKPQRSPSEEGRSSWVFCFKDSVVTDERAALRYSSSRFFFVGGGGVGTFLFLCLFFSV